MLMMDILMLMMRKMTSSKNARPVCESSREKVRHHSPMLGSEHIPYTPDHHHNHDDFDDGGKGNDHHVECRRDIKPGRLNIGGLQHTCWLILGGCNHYADADADDADDADADDFAFDQALF